MGILDKIKGAVNPNGDQERGRDHAPAHGSHLNPDKSDKPRSESRGRGLVGTGRGGAGNMSRSRVRGEDESPEVVAEARSRSRSRNRAHDLGVAAGRGGAGNVRHPGNDDAGSRDRAAKLDHEDKIVEEKYEAEHQGTEHASGRGGFGNVPHHQKVH